MTQKNIAIIFGGRSSEHEVSIQSAKNIFAALDQSRYTASLLGISKQGTWFAFTSEQLQSLTEITDAKMGSHNPITLFSENSKGCILDLKTFKKTNVDCAFPIVHGTNGEDGTLQGFFKTLNIPFVGCGILGSAICMDKEYMKIVMSFAGIKNSKFMVLHKHKKPSYDEIVKNLGTPFFIKPANAGSSVGVHKVKNATDFQKQIQDAFQYDHKIIAEEFIDGREIECSVKGLQSQPQAAMPGELVVKHEFYSYEAKYIDANGAEIIIPAKLTAEQIENVRQLAVQTYEALNCDGMARVDFFMKKDGSLIVNEVNTLPGFTKISMYPMMWKAKGLEYSALITELIQFAFEKHQYDSEIKLTF